MTAPFRIFETRPKAFTVRAWREIKKETFRAVAEMWFEKYLKKHFQRGAAQRYGYQARSASYLARKRRAARKGREGAKTVVRSAEYNLLTFTGALERAIMARASFHASENRFSIKMQGLPSYVGINSRRGKPDYHDEITRITPDEHLAMRELADAVSTKLSERYLAQRSSRFL